MSTYAASQHAICLSEVNNESYQHSTHTDTSLQNTLPCSKCVCRGPSTVQFYLMKKYIYIITAAIDKEYVKNLHLWATILETRFFVTILFLTTHLQSGQSLQILCLFLNMVYDMSQPTALHPPICGCGWVRQSYCSVMGVCKGFLYICGTGRLFWIWKQLSVL